MSTVHPKAQARTPASVIACDIALIQRNAPYCVACRGLCFFGGFDESGRTQWTCRPCGEVFDGSSGTSAMPVPQQKPAMRERVELGPDEEAALESIRESVGRSELGHEEETTLEAMRDGELSEEEARRIADVDQEVAAAIADDPPRFCRCGRDVRHLGRCSFRRSQESNGHKAPVRADPRQGVAYKALDLVEVEEIMARAETIAGGAAEIGFTTSQLSSRRQKDAELDNAILRGRDRFYERNPIQKERRSPAPTRCENCGAKLDLAKRVNMGRCTGCWLDYLRECRERKSEFRARQEIEPKRYGPFCEQNCDPETVGHHQDCAYWKEQEAMNNRVARNLVSVETQKPAMAQVQVAGRVQMDDDIEVRVSEIAQWPQERISEFFDALARTVELPVQRKLPTRVRPGWSPDFETNGIDDVRGLTMCYLVGMLHDGMEPHEKEAVWTLVQYLKRIEASVETPVSPS